MQRREFIAVVGGAAVPVGWPLAAQAQQSVIPIIGYLFGGPRAASFDGAFRKGLSEMGFIEGRNVAIESRYSEDRLPELAAELVRRRVAVIYAGGATAAALAAKAATTTIPIIFAIGNDPVEAGVVASFNRPGGNLTGISMMLTELTGKRLGLLHELVPSASRFALLVDSNSRDVADQTAGAKAAVTTLGRQIEVFTASTNDEIDSAFARMVQWRAEALLIGASPLFASTGQGGRQLATLAVRHALPAIHFQREFIEIGGLMSYGPSIPDTVRQAGIYVGRVLKGEKATDLPVMQPTRFQLVINLTTAKAIGLEVPPTLLALADEVIQ